MQRDIRHRDPDTQALAEELCGVWTASDALHIQHPHAGTQIVVATPASASPGACDDQPSEATSDSAQAMVPHDCMSDCASEAGDRPGAASSSHVVSVPSFDVVPGDDVATNVVGGRPSDSLVADAVNARHPHSRAGQPDASPDKRADESNELNTSEECVPGPTGSIEDTLQDFDYHCLTHKPSRSHDCEDCMRGKTRNRRKLTGAFDRKERGVQNFGDLITMDHIHMKDLYGRPGLGGGVH